LHGKLKHEHEIASGYGDGVFPVDATGDGGVFTNDKTREVGPLPGRWKVQPVINPWLI
jgi:hypothetical protein